MIPLKLRKAYLATIPWVTILKEPVPCEGWKGGKSPRCTKLAHYSFQHSKARYTLHSGQRRRYCWTHLMSRGLYGNYAEEARTERWLTANPAPWLTVHVCDHCSLDHTSEFTLQYLKYKWQSPDSGEVFTFSVVVCVKTCASKVRRDPNVVEFLEDKPWEGEKVGGERDRK